jgi:hypothetical protein
LGGSLPLPFFSLSLYVVFKEGQKDPRSDYILV